MHNIFRMGRLLLVVILFLLFCCPSQATIDLSEIGMGARPLGLGSAFAGGIDDASSIFTNPAGLALSSGFKAVSMSGTILSETNYLLAGLANSSPLGKVAIGYINASLPSIPLTTLEGTGSSAKITQTGVTDYSSSMIFFSYANRLSRVLKGKGDNVLFGANLKYFLQGFSGGGAVMQDAAGVGMDADLGLIWEVNSWARLGLLAANFLPVNFGGRFIWQKNSQTDGIPLSLRTGGAFKILGGSGWRQKDRFELNLLLDYEFARSGNRPGVWHSGIEFYPLDILAIRAGVDQKPKASEDGIGTDSNMTFGVGVNYSGFSFDYAFHQFGELSENSTHFFSIGFRGEEMLKKRRKGGSEHGGLPIPEIVPKPKLKAFVDIAENYWARKPIEYLATLGIMGGFPDHTFHPDQVLTRQELAAILVKAKGFEVKKVNETGFKDVLLKNAFAPFISVAVGRGYIDGYPDGTFKPNKGVTRAEAAAIFAKFSGLYVKEQVTNQVFPDVPRLYWASPAIAASKEAGFFEYLSGGKFEAGAYITRAEAAEIISKTPFVKEKIKNLISGEE